MRWISSADVLPFAAVVVALVVYGVSRVPEQPAGEPRAAAQPRRVDWPALSTGPICTQINGTRRRYWHPFPGGRCDVREAPEWPPGDFAFVIDYLLPHEVIGPERNFILVPESDKLPVAGDF